MPQSILPALQGFITITKAMASFDALRKGRKGDIRSLIEELKDNSRICFRVVTDGVDHRTVIPKLSTVVFDRLNQEGFNFNTLKSKKIQKIPALTWT